MAYKVRQLGYGYGVLPPQLHLRTSLRKKARHSENIEPVSSMSVELQHLTTATDQLHLKQLKKQMDPHHVFPLVEVPLGRLVSLNLANHKQQRFLLQFRSS